jgi:hypothetical protein
MLLGGKSSPAAYLNLDQTCASQYLLLLAVVSVDSQARVNSQVLKDLNSLRMANNLLLLVLIALPSVIYAEKLLSVAACQRGGSKFYLSVFFHPLNHFQYRFFV